MELQVDLRDAANWSDFDPETLGNWESTENLKEAYWQRWSHLACSYADLDMDEPEAAIDPIRGPL